MSSITSDKIRRRQNAMKVIYDPDKGFKFESPYHVGVWLVIGDEADIGGIDLSGMTGGDEITLHVSGSVEIGEANLCDHPSMDAEDTISGAVLIRCIDGVRYMQGCKTAEPVEPVEPAEQTPYIYDAGYNEDKGSIIVKLINAEFGGTVNLTDLSISINGVDVSDNISTIESHKSSAQIFFTTPPGPGIAMLMFKSSTFEKSLYDSNVTMLIIPEPETEE